MDNKLILVLLTVSISLIEFSKAVDYCNIRSCENRPHTICIYQKPGPSDKCLGYQGSGLSGDEKIRILEVHNRLRQKVASGKETRGNPGPQPPAKYMPNLEWDDELEFVAQRWSDQCTWAHDECRDVDAFPVGQNIASIGTTGDINSIEVEEMVHNWYNEVKDFDKNDVLAFRNVESPVIGHYTQLVWGQTTKLGCGATKYKQGRFNKYYLVCNYGQAGNYIGEPVYESL